MPLLVWNQITGDLNIRNFDQGVLDTLGAVPNADAQDPCYSISILFPDGSLRQVPVYLSQPEPIFQLKKYPFITVNRDDFLPAMNRWHSWGQLEYKAGVSGTQTMVNGVSGFTNYQGKVQAFPYDITYTISAFDRYETGAQVLLSKILKVFPPICRLIVFDSLGLQRTYDAYSEGSIADLKELIDPVQRVRGYAITIRVEGELDLADPYTTNSVSGVDANLHRRKENVF